MKAQPGEAHSNNPVIGSAKRNKAKAKKRPKRRRHVPQRTCVGCRTTQPKRELIRVVRTSTGTVEIDPGGKRAGRGAYLCRQKSCWQAALKRHSIERALKITMDKDARATLSAYVQALPEN